MYVCNELIIIIGETPKIPKRLIADVDREWKDSDKKVMIPGRIDNNIYAVSFVCVPAHCAQ